MKQNIIFRVRVTWKEGLVGTLLSVQEGRESEVLALRASFSLTELKYEIENKEGSMYIYMYVYKYVFCKLKSKGGW